MHHLNLLPESLDSLPSQFGQNGTFVHPLRNGTGMITAMAYVTFEQCRDAVHVSVRLGDSLNSITLARRDDAAERVARFLLEQANGVEPSSVPEPNEHERVSELELTLRYALRRARGTYDLPVEGLEDLSLCLGPVFGEPDRTSFRFELNGESLTLPMKLPGCADQAFSLLEGYVQELVANYRNVA